MTETRVDFNSSLQIAGDALVMASAGPKTNQYWQIFPVSDSHYQIRNQASGVNKQLATCYNPQEADASQTQPCMQPASGAQSQLWIVNTWGDGTYRFVNVGNGSGYNMDCHPGNPMFMSSNTALVPRQPAQHWEFSSLRTINDGAYSTTITVCSLLRLLLKSADSWNRTFHPQHHPLVRPVRRHLRPRQQVMLRQPPPPVKQYRNPHQLTSQHPPTARERRRSTESPLARPSGPVSPSV